MTDTTPIATTENRLAAREAITAARVVVERLREEQPNNADVITTALDWAVVMTDVASLSEDATTTVGWGVRSTRRVNGKPVVQVEPAETREAAVSYQDYLLGQDIADATLVTRTVAETPWTTEGVTAEPEQPRERPAEAAAAELLKAAENLQEVLGRYRTPSWPDHSGMAPPRVAGHIAHALEIAAAAARELSSQGWIADYTEDTDTLAPHLPALEQAAAAYARAVRELP